MNAEELYPKFSDQEYARRYRLVRQAMAGRGLDCLVVYGQVGIHGSWQANIHYLSNYADTHYYGYLIFPLKEEPTLLIAIYPHVKHAAMIASVKDVRWGGWRIAETIVARIKELSGERWNIGIVGPSSWWDFSIPVEHWNTLRQGLPQARFDFVTRMLDDIRMIKSEEEIRVLERAAEYTDMALEGLVRAIRPGAKDYELVAALRHAYLSKGGFFSFELLGSTPMDAPVMPYPWKYPLNREVRKGDLVVTEISAAYNFYAGQVIRPIAVGVRPTKVYERLFQVALETHDRVASALRPGNTEKDIVEALAPIRDAGFEVHAPVIHGWAQGIGEPFAGLPEKAGWPVTPVTFKPGMAVMIEPNPVDPDQNRGIFFGNLHVVTETGSRNLQKFPKEFIVV
jgi:Xaa-Pro dipeptidase